MTHCKSATRRPGARVTANPLGFGALFGTRDKHHKSRTHLFTLYTSARQERNSRNGRIIRPPSPHPHRYLYRLRYDATAACRHVTSAHTIQHTPASSSASPRHPSGSDRGAPPPSSTTTHSVLQWSSAMPLSSSRARFWSCLSSYCSTALSGSGEIMFSRMTYREQEAAARRSTRGAANKARRAQSSVGSALIKHGERHLAHTLLDASLAHTTLEPAPPCDQPVPKGPCMHRARAHTHTHKRPGPWQHTHTAWPAAPAT